MKFLDPKDSVAAIEKGRLERRKFLTQAGLFTMGAAAASVTLGSASVARADSSSGKWNEETEQAKDTVKEIFTAALIAEDLASTFYYNVLVGPVIQNVNLAGPGGSANDVKSDGNKGNVEYLQAALTEEISHASLFRSLLGISDSGNDPVQNFYFPADTFSDLSKFLATLDALENAFIGAYMNAIQEFGTKSAYVYRKNPGDETEYTVFDLDYFAKVSASIMGIECEHRVLGRVIGNNNPANNLAYEQTDGLNAVYNGPNSAVAALTPFLTPSHGSEYSLATALAKQKEVSIKVSGNPPAY